MGGALGGISKDLNGVLKGLNVSATMLQSMQQIANTGDQRAAFNAILLATAANVSKKPNFNLELEINDLWTRLGNLRHAAPAGPTGGLSQALQNFTQILPHLEGALKSLAEGRR